MAPEFEAMLADPIIQRGIAAVEGKLLDVAEGRLAAMNAWLSKFSVTPIA
jgi:hypothetical protein